MAIVSARRGGVRFRHFAARIPWPGTGPWSARVTGVNPRLRERGDRMYMACPTALGRGSETPAGDSRNRSYGRASRDAALQHAHRQLASAARVQRSGAAAASRWPGAAQHAPVGPRAATRSGAERDRGTRATRMRAASGRASLFVRHSDRRRAAGRDERARSRPAPNSDGAYGSAWSQSKTRRGTRRNPRGGGAARGGFSRCFAASTSLRPRSRPDGPAARRRARLARRHRAGRVRSRRRARRGVRQNGGERSVHWKASVRLAPRSFVCPRLRLAPRRCPPRGVFAPWRPGATMSPSLRGAPRSSSGGIMTWWRGTVEAKDRRTPDGAVRVNWSATGRTSCRGGDAVSDSEFTYRVDISEIGERRACARCGRSSPGFVGEHDRRRRRISACPICTGAGMGISSRRRNLCRTRRARAS